MYTERVKALEINPDCNKKDLKIVFTPLHGTANIPVRRVLTECGYDQLHVVEEQCVPDPNFSTVNLQTQRKHLRLKWRLL